MSATKQPSLNVQLAEEVERLRAEMFDLIKTLNSSAYSNISDQIDDAIRVGALAQDIKQLRATINAFEKRRMDVEKKGKS